jgi:ubiquinone biosynthesis protein UbiJ
MRMLTVPALGFINHILARESWACARLQPFSGQTAHLQFGALSVPLGITPAGFFSMEVGSAESAMDATVTIRLPDDAPLRLLTDRPSLFANAHIAGSAELAETLGFVFRHLRWHVEDDLALLVGDIAAHRLLLGGKRLVQWHAQTVKNFAANITEYLSEETSSLVRRAEVASFADSLAQLCDDCTQLEKRLQKFAAR